MNTKKLTCEVIEDSHGKYLDLKVDGITWGLFRQDFFEHVSCEDMAEIINELGNDLNNDDYQPQKKIHLNDHLVREYIKRKLNIFSKEEIKEREK